MVNKLTKSAKTMRTLVANNPNTKAEIKKEIAKIGRFIETLAAKTREWDTYPAKPEDRKPEAIKDKKDCGCQVNITEPGQGKRSIGIQIDMESEIEEIKPKTEIFRIYEEESTTFDEIKQIIDKRCTEDIYKKTTLDYGTLTQAGKESDLALAMDIRNINDRGLLKAVVTKYPEIADLIEQGMKEGKAEYIQNITSTTSSRGNKEVVTKHIYLLPTEIDKTQMTDVQELYQMIKQTEEFARRQGTKKLVFAAKEGISDDYMRKLLEYVFRKTNITIMYLTTKA